MRPGVDPIRRALDGDDEALAELRRALDAPPRRMRWRTDDGGLTSLSLAVLVLLAGSLAIVGQAQAFGLFYLSPPHDTVGTLWAWFGSKLPLCVLVWLLATARHSGR